MEISKENLERLQKMCEKYGDEFNSISMNNHLEDLLDEGFNELLDEKEKIGWKKKDNLKYLALVKIAESEGIKIPNKELFEDSNDLRGFLMGKFFINDLAMEKMCKMFLPFYEKLDMSKFGNAIAETMNKGE